MLKHLLLSLTLLICFNGCGSALQPETVEESSDQEPLQHTPAYESSDNAVSSISQFQMANAADSTVVIHENGTTTILAHDNTSAVIEIQDTDNDDIWETKTLLFYWEPGSPVTRGGFNRDYERAEQPKEFQALFRFVVNKEDLRGEIAKVHLKCNQFDDGDDIDGRAVIYTSPLVDWQFRPLPDNPDSFLVDLPDGLFPINEEHGEYVSHLDLEGRAKFEQTFSFDISSIITGPGVYTLVLTYDETRYPTYGNSLKLINRFNPEYLDAVDKLPRIEITYSQSTSVRVRY